MKNELVNNNTGECPACGIQTKQDSVQVYCENCGFSIRNDSETQNKTGKTIEIIFEGRQK